MMPPRGATEGLRRAGGDEATEGGAEGVGGVGVESAMRKGIRGRRRGRFGDESAGRQQPALKALVKQRKSKRSNWSFESQSASCFPELKAFTKAKKSNRLVSPSPSKSP